MTTQRLSKLFKMMKQNKLETIAFNPGASLFYLTGLHFHLMERPVVLFLNLSKTPLIVLPKLEILKINQSSIPLDFCSYDDDPSSWLSAFSKAFDTLDLKRKIIGVEPTQIRYLEMDLIQKAGGGVEFIPANKLFSPLRVIKDLAEIEKIRKAVRIAETALLATKPFIKIGKTEKEISSELTIQLLRAGSDTTFPLQPIVSSGPNSANPHALPTERKLGVGDLLVIDWGAAFEGYISDLTRTFAIGSISTKFTRIADFVLTANQAGCNAVVPKEPIGNIDDAARGIISKAGFGQFFTHRTGHGIGLEEHEDPYLFSHNALPLKEGMCFTIEPGIYIPGEGGVRIEDDVVVTSSGCEVLSNVNRKIELLN